MASIAEIKNVYYMGADVSDSQLRGACDNLKAAGLVDKIDLLKVSVTELPLPSQSVDVIISDIPFGKKFKLGKDIKSILQEMERVLRVGGAMVLLLSEDHHRHLRDCGGNSIPPTSQGNIADPEMKMLLNLDRRTVTSDTASASWKASSSQCPSRVLPCGSLVPLALEKQMPSYVNIRRRLLLHCLQLDAVSQVHILRWQPCQDPLVSRVPYSPRTPSAKLLQMDVAKEHTNSSSSSSKVVLARTFLLWSFSFLAWLSGFARTGLTEIVRFKHVFKGGGGVVQKEGIGKWWSLCGRQEEHIREEQSGASVGGRRSTAEMSKNVSLSVPSPATLVLTQDLVDKWHPFWVCSSLTCIFGGKKETMYGVDIFMYVSKTQQMTDKKTCFFTFLH
ncbi:hypothetical protein A6R68_11187, partial [Neotoma lepida]